jgi:hypothetical protein
MPDGRLSCVGPGTNNDGLGRVESTLDMGNAQGAMERRGPLVVEDSGNYDFSGESFKDDPPSILRDNTRSSLSTVSPLKGWWKPDRIMGDGAVRKIPTLTNHPIGGVGDVFQPTAANQPVKDGVDVTYDGVDDRLETTSANTLIPTGSYPCMWAVGSIGLTGSQALVTLLDGASVNLLALGRTPAGIYGTTSHGGSGFTARLPGVDAGLHLFSVRWETTRAVLKVDDTEVELAATGASTADLVTLVMGNLLPGAPFFPLDGRLNEAVLTDSVPTAAQIAGLEAYFQRTYPELPQ